MCQSSNPIFPKKTLPEALFTSKFSREKFHPLPFASVFPPPLTSIPISFIAIIIVALIRIADVGGAVSWWFGRVIISPYCCCFCCWLWVEKFRPNSRWVAHYQRERQTPKTSKTISAKIKYSFVEANHPLFLVRNMTSREKLCVFFFVSKSPKNKLFPVELAK